MATKSTIPVSARRPTMNTQRRGSSTTSDPPIRNSRKTPRAPVVAPSRLPVSTRFSRTEQVNWGLIRPWSIRTILLHITITTDGWEAPICLETPRRTTYRRVSYRNSIALGLHRVVWGEVAKVNVIVEATRTLDTLSHSGRIPLRWDNSTRHTLGCYLNSHRRSNTQRGVPRVWRTWSIKATMASRCISLPKIISTSESFSRYLAAPMFTIRFQIRFPTLILEGNTASELSNLTLPSFLSPTSWPGLACPLPCFRFLST